LKILNKVLLVLFVLSVIPLGILGYMAIGNINGMQNTALENVDLVRSYALDDSNESLSDLGSLMIKQIANDVAKQLEIFIRSNPDMTVLDLQNDSYFSALSVQPVGDTGYTAVTDVDTLICRFHASAGVVNLDLHNLAEKLPGFWSVMSKTETGKVSEGFYDWAEADGTIKKKYMYIAIVNARTADDVQFSVAATTYIDEFSAPVVLTKQKLDESINEIKKSIDITSFKIQNQAIMFTLVTILLLIIIGFLFASSITKPIKQLNRAGMMIADGQLDTQMPTIKSSDEIKDLSNTMNLLVGAIKFLKKNQK